LPSLLESSAYVETPIRAEAALLSWSLVSGSLAGSSSHRGMPLAEISFHSGSG